MTRLISGRAGGRRLKVPPSGVRPTGDRAREGLFNSLGTLLDLEGATVLDLYAGSGALGLEALSRGAAHATFIDNDPRAIAVIERNLGKLGGDDRALVRPGSALSLPQSAPFDLIFADPPYDTGSGSAVVGAVTNAQWLAPGGWMSVETGRGDEVEAGELAVEAVRDVGRARLTLLRRP